MPKQILAPSLPKAQDLRKELKILLISRNSSLTELSKKIGVKRQLIVYWFSAAPSNEAAGIVRKKILDTLSVDYDNFIKGEIAQLAKSEPTS